MSSDKPLIIYRIYRGGYRIPGEYNFLDKARTDAFALNRKLDEDQKRSGGIYEVFECYLTTGERKLPA